MSFRTRLLILIFLAVSITAGLVTWIAVVRMRRAYESLIISARTYSINQFRQEYERLGKEVVSQIEGIANDDSIKRLAYDASLDGADLSPYVNKARNCLDEIQKRAPSKNHTVLEFLELMDDSGAIISSAQWPARYGYKAEWIAQPVDWNVKECFLKIEELPEETVLALATVRTVSVDDKNKKLYIAGGCRLGREFLSSMLLQPGMRVLLYPNLTPKFSPSALIMDPGSVLRDP